MLFLIVLPLLERIKRWKHVCLKIFLVICRKRHSCHVQTGTHATVHSRCHARKSTPQMFHRFHCKLGAAPCMLTVFVSRTKHCCGIQFWLIRATTPRKPQLHTQRPPRPAPRPAPSGCGGREAQAHKDGLAILSVAKTPPFGYVVYFMFPFPCRRPLHMSRCL
eukprot:jgi/Ulvmu1/10611/UM065_0067.1